MFSESDLHLTSELIAVMLLLVCLYYSMFFTYKSSCSTVQINGT